MTEVWDRILDALLGELKMRNRWRPVAGWYGIWEAEFKGHPATKCRLSETVEYGVVTIALTLEEVSKAYLGRATATKKAADEQRASAEIDTLVTGDLALKLRELWSRVSVDVNRRDALMEAAADVIAQSVAEEG